MADPVVAENDRRVRYLVTDEAGQDEFEYDFDLRSGDAVVAADELTVTVDDVAVAFTVNATTKLVTLDVPADKDSIVVIDGNTKVQRDQRYPLSGGLSTARLNAEFNQIFYILQERARDSGRQLQLPKSAGTGVNPILPTLTAGRALIVNDDATAFEMGPTAAEIQNAQANADQVAADKAIVITAKNDAVAAKEAAEEAAAGITNEASGITVDDVAFTEIVGENVQDALDSIDDRLSDLGALSDLDAVTVDEMDSGAATAGQYPRAVGDGTTEWADLPPPAGITEVAAVATTSGTEIDIGSLPAGIKRLFVKVNGVSVTGTSPPIFQIGTISGVENTAYAGAGGVNASQQARTDGFGITGTSQAVSTYHGIGILAREDASSNKWTWSFVGGLSNAAQVAYAGGTKTLSGTLDRIRLTTVGGSDTFDAGSISISYE